ncbi:DNA gyrase subunit A [Candidatus Collierbacteria bacterium]|nr:DNA gyrase subunit A [Candidatus Collierbacteria bacterium]
MDNSSIIDQLTKTDYGLVKSVAITTEMERSYLDYAMSVIVARALPDVRDGLKPVHRRILYTMKGLGLTKGSTYKKTARIVGEVLGKYHPHGDMAVYDALVRLAQDFSMRYRLVDGQGNFGSIDGDPPAAMRYTEARMERITAEILADLEKETVDFMDNFDGSQREPTVLPAKVPNLLLMGSDGIAVGMATKIPPHNLTEVCDAIHELIEKGSIQKTQSVPEISQLETADPSLIAGDFSSEASISDLLQFVKGPDFPTGGIIYDAQIIADVYSTGRGSIVVRGVAAIEETRQGRFQIIITQIPYQVNKARLVAKIADLVKQKRIEGIADLRDESDRDGLRIAVDLKKDSVPKAILNQLYKYTELQTTFPANIVALTSHGIPQLMNLKTILSEFVRHRQVVVVRRSQFDLKAAKARNHILEGLLKAIDILDEVISAIRKSKDADEAKLSLISKFGFSELQAIAILEMQLKKLAALERQKLVAEYESIKQMILKLTALLSDPKNILAEIISEMNYLKGTYADGRKTRVIKGKIGEFSDLDLVPQEEVIIIITETGYIKRMPSDIYRSQRRGGKGVKGMETKEEDAISTILTANTHDDILFFTNLGKVYRLKAYELPSGGRLAKGQAIVNLLNLSQDESIRSTLTISKDSQTKFIVAATKHGLIKKTSISQYANIKSSGLIAIDLRDGDELVKVMASSNDDHILLATYNGKAIRFSEKDVRSTGRDTQGVKGIEMSKTDQLLSMTVLPSSTISSPDKRRKVFRELLVVTEKGIGKRTAITEYPVQNRGGQGVKVAVINDKTGNVAAAILATDLDEFIVITTSKAQAIKLPLKNIPVLKRPTQGVILVRLSDKTDFVAAVATIEKED